jgi:hypothetical protein
MPPDVLAGYLASLQPESAGIRQDIIVFPRRDPPSEKGMTVGAVGGMILVHDVYVGIR